MVMHPLTAPDTISLWEAGHSLRPPERALLLLTLRHDDEAHSAIRQWPLGDRDQALIRLFAATFGPVGEAVAPCPTCEQQTGFKIDFKAMGQPQETPSRPCQFQWEGGTYPFRPPNSDDLVALATIADEALALKALARACVQASTAVPPQNDGFLSAFGEALSKSDPFAEIRLAMACPECGHQWEEPFDIVDYFWHVLTREAQNLLAQVDLLARTYGWSEGDILRLSPVRRALYVEMILS